MRTVTLNAAKAAVEQHIGFPASRTRTVAQRLQEHDILPSGAPGVSPELNLKDVVKLVLALAADTTLAKVAEAVGVYGSLTPGGADLSVASAKLQASAGRQLLAIASLAAEGDDDMRRIKIEIVSSWPEVAFHWSDGRVDRFRQVGELAAHWGNGSHRKSIAINGRAFAGVFQELFG